MSNIGKDTENFFDPKQKLYADNRIELLRKFASSNKATTWYDAGSGASYMRTCLQNFFGKKPDVFEIDLDREKVPALDNSYDVITHSELIEHLFNPLFAMQECYRILKRGGKLYLFTPNDYGLIYKIEHLLSKKYEPHFHQFGGNDLMKLLKEAEFHVNFIAKFRRSKGVGTIARLSKNGLFCCATKV